MALATTNGPSQFKSLFDGDLSSADSENETPNNAVLKVTRSPSKKKKKAQKKQVKTGGRPQRPKRQEAIKSYAESDTDEDSVPPNVPIQTTKRKRTGSLTTSPNKKVKLDVLQSSRGRSFSSSQLPSPQKAKGLAASLSTSLPEAVMPSPFPLATARKRAFIRLGIDGKPAESSSIDGYWWPAKKSAAIDDGTVTYQLYGDDGHGSGRNVELTNPQSTNLQSIYFPRPPLPRYSQTSFQQGSIIEAGRFMAAFTELNQDDEDEDEDEDILGQYENAASDSEHGTSSQVSVPDWRPPSPSEFEYLIDEPVLCKSKSGSTVYWPARIIGYIPPTKPSQKPRFEVGFFDWKTGEVTRDMFLIQYDEDREKFAKCELDRRKLQEWMDKNCVSPTDDDEVAAVDITTLPEPDFPIPKPSVFIQQMTIAEQFVYVIPFMRRILEENYPPSQERVDLWMKGGATRASVTNDPIQGGNLAEVEWQLFGRLVHTWALPGFDHSKKTEVTEQDESNKPEEQRDRPRGSERYENLPPSQKLQFIVDVLIGEAVIQLLIIRAGKRSNLDFLGDVEEAELYQSGLKMSKQQSTSITVITILEERRNLRSRLGLPPEPLIAAGAKPQAEAEIGGRRSKARIHSQ